METFSLDSLSTYHLAVGLCISSHLQMEDVSLMTTEQGTYEYKVSMSVSEYH